MTCEIRRLRPGQEPPAPPPPPAAPEPTGHVCPTPEERAGMSTVFTTAQEINRLNGIGSVPATKFYGVQSDDPDQRVRGLMDLIADARAALDRLEQAHQDANRSGR